MKIAIFHNFMDNIGGAEMVSLTLARELSGHIYTTNIDWNKIKKMGFEDVAPRIHSIGAIPIHAPFKQQWSFWKFRQLNLGRQYDFYIISGDWAMSAAVNHQPNLWYIHSPLNELWQFKNFIRQEILKTWQRPIFDLWVWYNRRLTLEYAKHIERWICNSSNTQNRIKNFYHQDATIIFPPIDTQNYSYAPNQNYWLAVNRLFTNKRIEMQLQAFAKLPNEKLIVVGSYEKGATHFESYKNHLEKIKPDNVTFLHWVNNQELKKLYAECKGFITTARDEDFGMTVIEAMASGKPVISPNEGGYRETIINNQTGILINDINEEKLTEAIKKINEEININPERYRGICQNQAKRFDHSMFIDQIKNAINLKFYGK